MSNYNDDVLKCEVHGNYMSSRNLKIYHNGENTSIKQPIAISNHYCKNCECELKDWELENRLLTIGNSALKKEFGKNPPRATKVEILKQKLEYGKIYTLQQGLIPEPRFTRNVFCLGKDTRNKRSLNTLIDEDGKVIKIRDDYSLEGSTLFVRWENTMSASLSNSKLEYAVELAIKHGLKIHR